jgi:hypothetical protein
MFGGDSPIEEVPVEGDDGTRDSFAVDLADRLGAAAAPVTSSQSAPKSGTAGNCSYIVLFQKLFWVCRSHSLYIFLCRCGHFS